MKGERYDAAFKHEAIKKIREDGEHAFPGKGKLIPADEEMRRFKKENADLREENEILKKAAVIFAKHHK